eukprot:SAG31_NODE_2635_length_5340_cov_15.869681_1_plen_170_part_00
MHHQPRAAPAAARVHAHARAAARDTMRRRPHPRASQFIIALHRDCPKLARTARAACPGYIEFQLRAGGTGARQHPQGSAPRAAGTGAAAHRAGYPPGRMACRRLSPVLRHLRPHDVAATTRTRDAEQLDQRVAEVHAQPLFRPGKDCYFFDFMGLFALNLPCTHREIRD